MSSRQTTGNGNRAGCGKLLRRPLVAAFQALTNVFAQFNILRFNDRIMRVSSIRVLVKTEIPGATAGDLAAEPFVLAKLLVINARLLRLKIVFRDSRGAGGLLSVVPGHAVYLRARGGMLRKQRAGVEPQLILFAYRCLR